MASNHCVEVNFILQMYGDWTELLEVRVSVDIGSKYRLLFISKPQHLGAHAVFIMYQYDVADYLFLRLLPHLLVWSYWQRPSDQQHRPTQTVHCRQHFSYQSGRFRLG